MIHFAVTEFCAFNTSTNAFIYLMSIFAPFCTHSFETSWSVIFTIFQSFFLSSDVVDISEDAVSLGNFAVKARAALSSLSSPPDRVSKLQYVQELFSSQIEKSSISVSTVTTVLYGFDRRRHYSWHKFSYPCARYTLINVQTHKCTHYDTMIFKSSSKAPSWCICIRTLPSLITTHTTATTSSITSFYYSIKRVVLLL